MLRALAFAGLFVTVALVAVSPQAAAADQPDLCGDYGVCVLVCVDGVSAWCPGTACVGFSRQIPVCVPRST